MLNLKFILRSIGLIGIALTLLSGCGIKLAYNNMDRLVNWSLRDFVRLDDLQQDYFNAQLDETLYWHRTTQLPIYQQQLSLLRAQLEGELSPADLDALVTEAEAWGENILEQTLPATAELLFDLDESQVERLRRGMEESNEDILKPVRKLSLEQRQKRWRKDYTEGLDFIIGSLDDTQKLYLRRQAQRYEPEEELWVDFRRRWQQELLRLLANRDDLASFERAFFELVRTREDYYGPAYAKRYEELEALYKEVTLYIFNNLSERQNKKLNKRLDRLDQVFSELIAEAPANAPDSSCFLKC